MKKKTGLNGIQIHDHCDTNWEMVTLRFCNMSNIAVDDEECKWILKRSYISFSFIYHYSMTAVVYFEMTFFLMGKTKYMRV